MNMSIETVPAPSAQGQSTPPQPKITAVLTILTPKPGVTLEQVMKIMPAEIRATVPLKPASLEGKPRGRAVHSGGATLAARDTVER